jgi:hypothetical protein
VTKTISISYQAFRGRICAVDRSPVAVGYWETGESVASLAARFGRPSGQIRALAGAAMVLMPACPVCGRPFMATSREAAIRLLQLPVYPADAEQGLVPVCCGPWVSWFHPLEPAGSFAGDGDRPPFDASWRGEYGGGKIGARWRELNAR